MTQRPSHTRATTPQADGAARAAAEAAEADAAADTTAGNSDGASDSDGEGEGQGAAIFAALKQSKVADEPEKTNETSELLGKLKQIMAQSGAHSSTVSRGLGKGDIVTEQGISLLEVRLHLPCRAMDGH